MTNEFTRTTPIFEGYQIQIVIDNKNPLDVQLTMITGDGWNVLDWTNTLKTNVITHIKSGLQVKICEAK